MQLRRWIKNKKENSWIKYEWRLEQVRRSDIIIGIGFHENYTASNSLTLFLRKEFGIWSDLSKELKGKIPGYDGASIGLSGDDITIKIQIPEGCNHLDPFIRALAKAIAKFSYPLPLPVINDIRINWNLPPVYEVPSLKNLCVKYIQSNFSLFSRKNLEKLPIELKDDIGLPSSNFLLFNHNNEVDLSVLPFQSMAKHIESFFNQLAGNRCFSNIHLGYNDNNIHMDFVEKRFVHPIVNVLDENKIAYSIKERKIYDKFNEDKKVSELIVMTVNNNVEKLVLILKNMLDNKQKIIFSPHVQKSNSKSNTQPNNTYCGFKPGFL